MEKDVQHLLARAASGDREAAGEALRLFESPLRASIQHSLGRNLRRRVDPEDVYQSTMALALKDLNRVDYQGDPAFLGWLRAIAEHRILEVARRHGAAKRDLRKDRPLEAAGQTPSTGTSPTQGAVRGEIRSRLSEAVAMLPEPERHVVELHSYEGLSFVQVSERLGLKGRSSARSLFQKALHRMGDLLDGQGPPR